MVLLKQPVTKENGERVIAGTRRADGTMRKEKKIKDGYTPEEQQTSYQVAGMQVCMHLNAIAQYAFHYCVLYWFMVVQCCRRAFTTHYTVLCQNASILCTRLCIQFSLDLPINLRHPSQFVTRYLRVPAVFPADFARAKHYEYEQRFCPMPNI